MRKGFTTTALASLVLVAVMATPAFADGRAVKTKVAPAYPELAKRMNVSGVVKVELLVEPNGTVKEVKPIGGHPLLIDAAVKAAKQFKYETASQETHEHVDFNFNKDN